MKNIIIYFGSFDPFHKGHMELIKNSMEEINADSIYIGLNKNSPKGTLTPLYHRKKMLEIAVKNNLICKILPFYFDYKDLTITYKKIFSLIKENYNYYILLGEDQLVDLGSWKDIDLLKNKFKFIVAKRNLDGYNREKYCDNFIFIDNKYRHISSEVIRKGNYECTLDCIKNYIENNNLYLKNQIKEYLTNKRYKHVLSTARTALIINKKANLGLNKYVVEKAALLHDIAKNIEYDESLKLIKEKYPDHSGESSNVLHQYLVEYIAREKFNVKDKEILNAIKFHTTGRANMSKLEKLIFISDKIEPLRKVNTKEIIDLCVKNFDNAFIKMLLINKQYLESKLIDIDSTTNECYKFYLKNY